MLKKTQKLNEFFNWIKRKKTIFGLSVLFFICLSWWGYDKLKFEIRCNLPNEIFVTKVIDGDTVIIQGGKEIRLLGIDADERDYPCYESAKKLLEKLVLNKKVKLEIDKKRSDEYGRCLGYLFLNGENLNLKIVKEGEAVCRFVEPNLKYQKECEALEKEAIEKKIGCKWGGEIERKAYRKIKACQAKKYIGEFAFVEGKIVSSFRSKKDNIFLNFERRDPNQCFTAVIFRTNLKNFPEAPEEYYKNKKVRVFGKIEEYKEKPQIILESQKQIEILE